MTRHTGQVWAEHFLRFPCSANSTPSELALLSAKAAYCRWAAVTALGAAAEVHTRHSLAPGTLEKASVESSRIYKLADDRNRTSGPPHTGENTGGL
jgi:hypothetical protein